MPGHLLYMDLTESGHVYHSNLNGSLFGGGLALVQMWYLLFHGSSFASGCGE